MLQDIVTAFSGCVSSSPDGLEAQSTSDSTTLNVATLPTCEASIDGIDCQEPATQRYTIDTGDTRRLCDYHFRMLLRYIFAWHHARVVKRGVSDVCGESWQSEKGQVA